MANDLWRAHGDDPERPRRQGAFQDRVAAPAMSTNDHTVPQAYLRRFAQQRRNRRYFIVASRIDQPEKAFETNVRNVASENGFYWGTTGDGDAEHGMEELLGRIESFAIPAFNAILDDHALALIQRWPRRLELRARLAWWIAAQVLRTTRQRHRLGHLLASRPELDLPRPIAATVARNVHLGYIASQLGRLAHVLVEPPWGLGFSDACLATSDVPVVLLNAQDHDDQVLAAALYSILLPLDPHRFLFLPSIPMQEEDERKAVDHRLKLDGGMGVSFSQMVRDAADRHLFHRPCHPPPWVERHTDSSRVTRLWEGEDLELGPEYYISYATMHADLAVERRWIEEHPSAAITCELIVRVPRRHAAHGTHGPIRRTGRWRLGRSSWRRSR